MVIRNGTMYRLYTNGSPEGSLSNCGSRISGIIMGQIFAILIKIDFWPKIYEKSLEDQ